MKKRVYGVFADAAIGFLGPVAKTAMPLLLCTIPIHSFYIIHLIAFTASSSANISFQQPTNSEMILGTQMPGRRRRRISDRLWGGKGDRKGELCTLS